MSIVNTKHTVHICIVLAVVFLGVVLVRGTAHADADMGRTGLLITDAVSPHAREVAASTIESIAREGGFPFAKETFTPKEATALSGCVTAPQAWSCAAPVVRGKGLEQIAVVSLAADTSRDGSPMIVITEQILVARLDAAVGAQRFCVRCTDDVLIKSTSELTHALFQEITVRSGRIVVAISSTPRGARITFDGDSMGATDRSFNTFPGTHTVVLELDGYQRETRSIDTALDKTSELSVTMRPSVAADSPADRDDPDSAAAHAERRTLLAPKLVMGAGAVAVATGAALLAFNQKSITSPVGTKQRAYYYDTVTPGVSLIVGGVAAGVGGFLWWHDARSTMVPTVAPVAGGAVIGIAKGF